MEQKRLGVYFHPTTAVLVDDNKAFLNTLSLKLDSDIVYRLFVDPKLALEYVTTKKSSTPLSQKCLLADLSDEHPESPSLTLSVTDISAPLLNGDRFNEVSVIVLDFSMPTLDGLAFIEQLGETPIKIIMVTGEADQNLAVKLFNEGKIHRFILKREPRLEKLISDAIRDMQHAYFETLSSPILNSLARVMAPCLTDPVFIEQFSRVHQELKAVEYYLCEHTGSFILIDAQGGVHLLIVRMPDDLAMYADIAADQKADPALVQKIKTGAVLPFFGTLDQFIATKDPEWATHVHPAKQLLGRRHTYYYTVLTNLKQVFFPWGKNLMSFREYRRQS